MPLRLRYLQHDYELLEGEFMIGRGSKCQLSLDDPLVSRYHAKLLVTASDIEIEDLGSRNATIVNGERVEGKVSVKAGDRILIGQQELTLVEGRDLGVRATLRQTLSRSTPPSPFITTKSPEDTTGMTDRANAFALFGGAAEKAIALGRIDEAERLLSSAIAQVRLASRTGKTLSAELVDEAMRYAAKLATATGKGQRVDIVVEVYESQGRPCTGAVVDELIAAMHKVDAIDVVRLRAYVASLQAKQATYGPAEHFVLRRLAGLERLARPR